MTENVYSFIGCDFGQAQDYTAIAYADRKGNTLEYRHIERLKLGTRYDDQIKRIKEVWDAVSDETGKTPILIVDYTGVGRPIVENMRKENLFPIAVTVTGGTTSHKDGKNWTVPKKELVLPFIIGVQNGTVKLVEGHDYSNVIIDEMLNFKMKINIATGNESFEAWRERDHDDLVFAAALVAYAAKNANTGIGWITRNPFAGKYACDGFTDWRRDRYKNLV